jgi:hypothetical protein
MKWPVLCGHRAAGLWWVRVFGWGVSCKDVRRRPLLFSERVLGHGLQIGRWRLGWLSRGDALPSQADERLRAYWSAVLSAAARPAAGTPPKAPGDTSTSR